MKSGYPPTPLRPRDFVVYPSQSVKEKPMETMTPTAIRIPATTDMMVVLEKQQDNFPGLRELVRSLQLTSGFILLPQTLEQLTNRLSMDTDLVASCITYMEVVELTSLMVYGSVSEFTNQITGILTRNRHIQTSEKCLYLTKLDDFVWAEKEGLVQFLDNNPAILALYIFTLVNLYTFKD